MNAVETLLERVKGALEERWEVIAELIDAANTAVALCEPGEPEPLILYVNKGFTALSGYSDEEVVGKSCLFLQGDDVGQPGARQLAAAVGEGTDVQVTLLNYRKDGSHFYNEVYLTSVYGADVHGVKAEPSYFILVQNDVSSRRVDAPELRAAIDAVISSGELSRRILGKVKTLSRTERSFSNDERRLLRQLAEPPDEELLAIRLGWDGARLDNALAGLRTELGLKDLRQLGVWALGHSADFS